MTREMLKHILPDLDQMINGSRIIKGETETFECSLGKVLKFRQMYGFIKWDGEYIYRGYFFWVAFSTLCYSFILYIFFFLKMGKF